MKENITHITLGDAVPASFLANVDQTSVVGFAGSRHFTPSSELCSGFVEAFAAKGCSFAVGCADGVDAAFRRVLAESFYNRTVCFRAFSSRDCDGLSVVFTSLLYLPPHAALSVRTNRLVQHISHMVLFPGDWGKGSRLCLKLCAKRSLPLLLVK